MARITATERNFWLSYFRQKIQETIQDYRREHKKFLLIDLKAQSKAKANDQLGITALIATHEQIKGQLATKRKAHDVAQDKLRDKYQEQIKPLETQLAMVHAKRVAKVIDGSVSGWSKYTVGHNREPYEYDTTLRATEQDAHQELYDASDIGKHIKKLDQQYRDAPVALMLATSRLEMANAVRQLAVTIGITLPVTTSLEDLT